MAKLFEDFRKEVILMSLTELANYFMQEHQQSRYEGCSCIDMFLR